MTDKDFNRILPFESDFADVPVKDLACRYCNEIARHTKQFRMRPTECGQKTVCIGWVCPSCEGLNLTPDDDSILDVGTFE